ncbi:MAG: hypothetical protein J6Y17_03870 [Elusimicrobiaceae bacterium]|nr:hypothetical protein [Elusimicrobiaceae bacterium]
MTPPRRQRAKKRLFVRKTKRYSKVSILTVWRLMLFAAMLLLLLFCVAWVFLLRTFNAQHISEMVTQTLQQKLNRPVKISSLNLKYLNTVELKGFYVLDTYGEPGKPFLAADSVTLAFDILPLLENKMVIHEVTLNAPRFNLVRTQEGLYNVPRVKMGNTQPSTYTSGTGRKFAVSVEDWRIKDGVFSFKDLTSGAAHALYGVNATFENLKFNELSAFHINMVLRNEWQEKISEIEIAADGQINFGDFDWSQFALRGVNSQVHLFANPVEVELDADNLVEPRFKFSATVPSFNAKDVSLFEMNKMNFDVPVSAVSAQGTLSENYHKLTVENVTAQVGDLTVEAKGWADFSQDPWNAQVDFSTPMFTLPGKGNLWPALKQYKLTGRGSVAGQAARQNGKFTLPLLNVQVDNVSGDFYGFKANGITGNFQAKQNFADLYVRTQTGQVKVDRSTFDKLQLSGTWRKGNLYANIGSCELNGEALKLNLEVQNLKKDDRKIHTHLHFGNFDPMAFIDVVKDFVTVITPLTNATPTPEVTGELAWLRNFRDRLPDFMPNLAGTLSAGTFSSTVLSGNDFKAEFDLTGLQAGAKMLSGTIELKLQDGVIHQMEKLAAEQEALNVTFQPFIMMHRMERAGSFSVGKVLRDVEVKELAASVRFAGGGMEINNAYTVGPTISAAVSGWTDWVKETFDLTIFTMFTNTSKSVVLAENLTDESGNPALAFRVSSSMTKPKLEMLRAKKAGQTIRTAQEKGVTTDFSEVEKFIQGDFHATK